MQPAAEESPIAVSIDDHLDRLLAFEPSSLPVISLYLNTQADQHGRDNYEQFLKKELRTRLKTFTAGSADRDCFEQDLAKIEEFLANELTASANGVAVFACAGEDLFITIQLNAPLDEHRLYVYHQPHLYHLARLDDEYPRYAAVLTDANSARLYVFGLGETLEFEQVKGKKVQRVKVGGWSQARYQRRVENAHQNHAKEVVDALDRLVRDEGISHIVLAGDPSIVPLLVQELPKHLESKLVDVLKLDLKSSDAAVFEATLERMREEDAKTDVEKVERLLREFRARGLACIGSQDTLEALANGQVDELLISVALEQTHGEEEPVDALIAPEIPDSTGGTDSEEPRQALLADLLVTKARQTDARVSFIQDAALLDNADGVGAFLRWRV